MTPRQREMARHALGLPNPRGRSYRNRYVAAYMPGPVIDDWDAMVKAGDAERMSTIYSGGVRYWLTEQGARKALNDGETLCPEDFPKIA